MNHKEYLKKLLAQDNIAQVLKELSEASAKSKQEDLHNSIVLQQARFNSNEKDKNAGTLSNEYYDMTKAKIRVALQSLIEEYVPAPNYSYQEQEESSNNYLKILMLTANPAGTTKMNLDKEHSKIAEKLQTKQDKFSLIVQKAINRTELKEFTEMAKPSIVHFSGHGEGGDYGGIVVQNEDKNGYEMISTSKLDALFEYFKDEFQIKAVVLNACYSEEQAATISKYVPYVIGTTKSIEDEYAIAFSVGFYFKLVESGINFEQAYKSGRTEATLAGASRTDFVIYKNAEKLTL